MRDTVCFTGKNPCRQGFLWLPFTWLHNYIVVGIDDAKTDESRYDVYVIAAGSFDMDRNSTVYALCTAARYDGFRGFFYAAGSCACQYFCAGSLCDRVALHLFAPLPGYHAACCAARYIAIAVYCTQPHPACAA